MKEILDFWGGFGPQSPGQNWAKMWPDFQGEAKKLPVPWYYGTSGQFGAFAKLQYIKLLSFLKILTWQVPVLSEVPIEQSVVSCTIFPKDNWHSSLETTLTFNLFNTGLIDDAKNFKMK